MSEHFKLFIRGKYRTFFYENVSNIQKARSLSRCDEFSIYELELSLSPESYFTSLEVVLKPVNKIENYLEPEGKTLVEDYLDKKRKFNQDYLGPRDRRFGKS